MKAVQYDYQVIPLHDDIYLLDDFFHVHCYLIIGKEKALLIDTGVGVGNLADMVKQITEKEVLLVNTHTHPDHIGNNSLFSSVMISQEDKALYDACASESFKRKSLPPFIKEVDADFPEDLMEHMIQKDETVDISYLNDKQILSLGQRNVEIIATPGHTQGSLCFYDSASRSLFTGDTICDQSVLLCFEESADLTTYRKSLMKLYHRKEEIEKIYSAHHKIPLDITIVEQYLECVDDVLNGSFTGTYNQSAVGCGIQVTHGQIGIRIREMMQNEKRNFI
ncbi:MAG: MBL fold metallo-hydrolase [Lachnospiraceae bacterium]|nr:MBL fold metallo-hydrolase [Lachnospiraceae bacterium]